MIFILGVPHNSDGAVRRTRELGHEDVLLDDLGLLDLDRPDGPDQSRKFSAADADLHVYVPPASA
jgi:hypothetical protein